MNSWKDNISLFHLKPGSFFVAINFVGQYKIFGSTLNKTIFINKDELRPAAVPKDRCTLIARPISDMTNGEVIKALKFQDIVHEGRDFYFYRTWLEGCVNNWEEYDDDWDKERLSAEAQEYLLSIEVYPGHQSHFDLPDDDPAKVIDATKLEVA